MKNRTRLILVMMIAAMMCACAKIPASESIELAESEFAAGDLQSARERCQSLSDTTRQLGVTQLCRVAMLYMRIAEASDNQSDMAAAAKCYTRAVSIDSDSVDAYFTDLDVEHQPQARMLREISTAVTNPDSIVDAVDAEMLEYIEGTE